MPICPFPTLYSDFGKTITHQRNLFSDKLAEPLQASKKISKMKRFKKKSLIALHLGIFVGHIKLFLVLVFEDILVTFARAGLGKFFSGPGRVRAGLFWPGSGSGWPFLATGQFGPPILAYFGLFWPIFDQFFSLKCNFFGSGWVGPPKTWPGSGRALARPSPN